jgi:hypothetical protein
MFGWLWPFSKSEETEQAESEFRAMLHEATLRHEDLKKSAEKLRDDRLRRLERRSDRPSVIVAREKLRNYLT